MLFRGPDLKDRVHDKLMANYPESLEGWTQSASGNYWTKDKDAYADRNWDRKPDEKFVGIGSAIWFDENTG